ncbi:MAG: GNAT family N-acetyltransferase [Nanoarchaeota archaeon]|nr:GNAT family N-acetyltransferase [Nanoarchaeota archaeon]
MIQQIKLLKDPEELNRVYQFIKRFEEDYPDYLAWVEKCFRELQLGYKKAFVFEINNKIIANLICQKHKEDSSILELKNSRVENPYRRRKIFTKLLNKVEEYAIDEGFKRLNCDTHEDNLAVIKTLKKHGFKVEDKKDLYKRNRLETILIKDL